MALASMMMPTMGMGGMGGMGTGGMGMGMRRPTLRDAAVQSWLVRQRRCQHFGIEHMAPLTLMPMAPMAATRPMQQFNANPMLPIRIYGLRLKATPAVRPVRLNARLRPGPGAANAEAEAHDPAFGPFDEHY